MKVAILSLLALPALLPPQQIAFGEYAIPEPDSMTAGPEGAVWFATPI